jgi:hypothetical protein
MALFNSFLYAYQRVVIFKATYVHSRSQALMVHSTQKIFGAWIVVHSYRVHVLNG